MAASASHSVCDLLYTGGLFRCNMLDKSIVILGVSGLFCHFLFLIENPVSKQCRP